MRLAIRCIHAFEGGEHCPKLVPSVHFVQKLENQDASNVLQIHM